jgi:hypothetical protein
LTGSFFLGSDSFEGERAGADEAGTGNIVSSENAGFMGSWFLYEIEKKNGLLLYCRIFLRDQNCFVL